MVLTGEGADEVFGGYDLFKEAKIRRFWARQPAVAAWRRRCSERLYGYLRQFAGRATRPSRSRSSARAWSTCDAPIFAHVPRWTTTQRALAVLLAGTARERRRLGSAAASTSDAAGGTSCAGSRLARDQYVEAQIAAGRLPAVVAGRPRGAWPTPIEGRFPFLDHRVIEFANRLPPQLKIRGLNEKYMLRRALADLLPPTSCTRTKQPYRAPDSQSFFVDGKPLDYVADLLSAERMRDGGLLRSGRGRQAGRQVPHRPRHRLRRQHGVRRHPVDDAAGRDFHSSRLSCADRSDRAGERVYDAPAAVTRSTRNNLPSAASVSR